MTPDAAVTPRPRVTMHDADYDRRWSGQLDPRDPLEGGVNGR